MDFDYKEVSAEMQQIVATSKLSAGVKRLIAYCEKCEGDHSLAKRLSKLPYVKDAQGIAAQLKQMALKKKIPDVTQGFYLGLDGLNMPNGKGIEFGCSPTADDSEWAEWAGECDTYPGNLKSPVLSEMYRRIDGAGVWDYVLAQGYCGLAIRTAFESIPSKILLNGQEVLHVCWGFHDGDLQYMGSISSKGFKAFQPAPLEKVKNLKPVIRKFTKTTGAIHWIQRAEQIALQMPKPLERGATLERLAAMYAEVDAWESVDRVLHDIDLLRKSSIDLSDEFSSYKDDIISAYWRRKETDKVPDIGWFFGKEDVAQGNDRPIRTPAEIDLLKRLEALVWCGDKKLLKQDIKKLAKELAALKKQFGNSIRFRKLNSLFVKAYLSVHDIDKANRIVEDDEDLYYYYAPMCIRAGLPDYFLRSLEEQELKHTKTDLHNLHHLGNSFAKVARWYAEAGVVERYSAIVKRALELVPKALKLGVSPWQVSVLFGALAPVAQIANDKENEQRFSDEAVKWAEVESKSKGSQDSRTTVWLSVCDMAAALGDYEKAIIAAKRIPKKELSRKYQCRFFAQLNRDKEIDAVLRESKTAGGKIEVVLDIARSFIP